MIWSQSYWVFDRTKCHKVFMVGVLSTCVQVPVQDVMLPYSPQ